MTPAPLDVCSGPVMYEVLNAIQVDAAMRIWLIIILYRFGHSAAGKGLVRYSGHKRTCFLHNFWYVNTINTTCNITSLVYGYNNNIII